MGASECLTRRLNEELQRAFEAGVPSSQVYPSPQVHHIGTPSEHTTSEGFRSVLSQRTPSVQSHPTSSPISFGPSTPVQSASAAPAGLLSSPGGMSDVGSTLTPPGLPLRDPPRMAGSYGVSLNDPVFGISSGSIPCEYPGHRPMPAQAPIPPPPPQQGVGDPVAQLLVGQGAMSHLLIQMAQEMNRRTSEQGAGDPSQSSGQGSASGSRKEMKMDEKWIPSMPTASWKNWTSRKELSGFKSWLEQFSGWLCLIHDAYGPELKEAINSADPIRSFRTMRSKRLFHLLQQNFTGYSKIENYGGPSKAEPFFQQLADPKTALQSLTEMHLSMFKKEECHCSRPLVPQFQCCWKQPQKSHHPNRKAHSHQKSPSACTTLKLGGARGGLSPKPTYITMLAPHYLSIV